MKVRLKTNMSGPNGSAYAGSEIELSDVQARELISRGFAEGRDAAPVIETAAAAPAIETASISPVKQKRTRA